MGNKGSIPDSAIEEAKAKTQCETSYHPFKCIYNLWTCVEDTMLCWLNLSCCVLHLARACNAASDIETYYIWSTLSMVEQWAERICSGWGGDSRGLLGRRTVHRRRTSSTCQSLVCLFLPPLKLSSIFCVWITRTTCAWHCTTPCRKWKLITATCHYVHGGTGVIYLVAILLYLIDLLIMSIGQISRSNETMHRTHCFEWLSAQYLPHLVMYLSTRGWTVDTQILQV